MYIFSHRITATTITTTKILCSIEYIFKFNRKIRGETKQINFFLRKKIWICYYLQKKMRKR